MWEPLEKCMQCIQFNDLNAILQSKKNGLHTAPRCAADERAQRSCGYALFRWREQGKRDGHFQWLQRCLHKHLHDGEAQSACWRTADPFRAGATSSPTRA